MKNKVILIMAGFILITIILSSINVLPTRTEITEIDIANVIGLDIYNEDYEMTIVRNNPKDSVGAQSSGGTQPSGEETISIRRKSYIEDLLASQTISDKYLNISHANYYFIGSESVNSDLKHMVDYLARNYQTRINARVYIVKGDTAKKFLQKVSEEKFKLSDKLDNMEQNFESRGITKSTTVADTIGILLRNKMDGVIPVVKLVNKESEKIESTKDTTRYLSPFDFDGLAVIQGAKLVGYLGKEETKAFNYIMGDVTDFYISLKDKEAEIFFGMKNFTTDIAFDISNNKIDKVRLKITYKSSFEEIKSSIDVFTEENTKRYKDMQEQLVKKKIEQIIQKSYKMDVDYLELEDKLHMKHPYKCKKIKNVWEQIKKAKLEISVQSSLKTTFNVIQTNMEQEDKK